VVNVENSGTTLRFMTSAFAAAPDGYVVLSRCWIRSRSWEWRRGRRGGTAAPRSW
jgi:hypothetical protein